METNFDETKSKLEQLLDSSIATLERTHPEQTSDAMSDYVKVLQTLSPVSDDYQVKPITDLLKRLYVFPNRKEHNKLLLVIHEMKELLHELRINEALTTQEASKIAEKGLGNMTKLSSLPWLVISAIAIFIILR